MSFLTCAFVYYLSLAVVVRYLDTELGGWVVVDQWSWRTKRNCQSLIYHTEKKTDRRRVTSFN